MIPNPYLILAAGVCLLATHGYVYQSGARHMKNSMESEQLEAVEKAIKQHQAQAAKDQVITKEFEQVREVVKTVYIKVRAKANANIKKNPTYDQCSLDDDGLWLFNARADKESATGKPTR